MDQGPVSHAQINGRHIPGGQTESNLANGSLLQLPQPPDLWKSNDEPDEATQHGSRRGLQLEGKDSRRHHTPTGTSL